MNRFGFLAENVRPLGTGKTNLFSDCLLTRDEKKTMFGVKSKTLSVAQKAHQKNVKEVGKLRKQGYNMKDAWKIVKSGKKSTTVPKKKTTTVKPVKKTTNVPKKKTTTVKPRKTVKSKSAKDLTPAQKRAKRAMKLAHTKYKGDSNALKKAWKEVRDGK
jgi:hypothetical protein